SIHIILCLPVSDQCQVNNFERVPCGEPGISASNCSAIRCCFDDVRTRMTVTCPPWFLYLAPPCFSIQRTTNASSFRCLHL
uniref:P-type domain-containing protein n=1 Tax=Denticeps clupeoides TaxID=299321 RepID=A0A8C4CG89_9TELE